MLQADRGYDHDKYRKILHANGIRAQIARRGTAHGTGLGATRYVVEQTIALLRCFRPYTTAGRAAPTSTNIPQPRLCPHLLAPPPRESGTLRTSECRTCQLTLRPMTSGSITHGWIPDEPTGCSVRTPRDAELISAAWVRRFGYPDARATRVGTDDGIDVSAWGAVAQTKFWKQKKVGIEPVQRIAGTGTKHQKAIFFSYAGYTDAALKWLQKDDCTVAGFMFRETGQIKPVNRVADIMISSSPRIKPFDGESLLARITMNALILFSVIHIPFLLFISLALLIQSPGEPPTPSVIIIFGSGLLIGAVLETIILAEAASDRLIYNHGTFLTRLLRPTKHNFRTLLPVDADLPPAQFNGYTAQERREIHGRLSSLRSLRRTISHFVIFWRIRLLESPDSLGRTGLRSDRKRAVPGER